MYATDFIRTLEQRAGERKITLRRWYNNMLRAGSAVVQQEEKDEALAQAPARQEQEVDFKTRLEQSKTCVIGAGYGKYDAERWTRVDRHYIAITGLWDVFGTINGNPLKNFDWNTFGPTLWSTIFVKAFDKKRFNKLFIDRGTLLAHMDPSVFENISFIVQMEQHKPIMLPSLDVQFPRSEA